MKLLYWILFFSILVTGCVSLPVTDGNDLLPQLDNQGLAPELTNDIWINTEQPLRLSDLRGQVVLLEMWTFG
jgi:hypothetical protein